MTDLKNKLLLVLLLLLLAVSYYFWQKKSLITETKLITVKQAKQNLAIDVLVQKHLKTISERPSLIKALQRVYPTTTLTPFWLDSQEVKQGDFYQFTDWLKTDNNHANLNVPNLPDNWRYFSQSQMQQLSGHPEVPANSITFYDAYAYCQAIGGHLPSQYQFLAAAQGKENRLYPWGNQFNKTAWPYQKANLNATIRGGHFPQTNTPQGIADLGQLVSEWTMGNFPQGNPYVQGGNALNKPYALYALSAYYRDSNPLMRSQFVGFRCAYEKKIKKTPWQTTINAIEIEGGLYQFNKNWQKSKLIALLAHFNKLSDYQLNQYLNLEQKQKTIRVSTQEVTVSQYQSFLDDWQTKLALHANANEPKNHSLIPLNWQQQLQHLDNPVVGISWWAADHFSRWAGGRLPSEDEWLAILFSLPKTTDNAVSLHKEQQQGQATTVKQKNPLQFSMLGNVSEWTKTVDANNQNIKMVVKGGSFMIDYKDSQTAAFYRSVVPSHRDRDIGFRLVFD